MPAPALSGRGFLYLFCTGTKVFTDRRKSNFFIRCFLSLSASQRYYRTSFVPTF